MRCAREIKINDNGEVARRKKKGRERPQISRAFNYVPLTREVYRFPSRGTIESSLSISLSLSLSLSPPPSSTSTSLILTFRFSRFLIFSRILTNYGDLLTLLFSFPPSPLPPLIPFLYLFLSPFFSISLNRPKKWGLRFGVFAK